MRLSVEGARQIFTKTHHSSDEPDCRWHCSVPKPVEYPVQVGNIGLGQKTIDMKKYHWHFFNWSFPELAPLQTPTTGLEGDRSHSIVFVFLMKRIFNTEYSLTSKSRSRYPTKGLIGKWTQLLHGQRRSTRSMCQEVRRSYYEDQKNRKLRKMIIMILVLRSCGFLKIVNLMVVISGGDKPIERRKLSWTSKSKIGSLEKANHRPGGGQVHIFFAYIFFQVHIFFIFLQVHVFLQL